MIPFKYIFRAPAIEIVLRHVTLDKQETKALQNGYAFGETKKLVDDTMDRMCERELETESYVRRRPQVPFEVVCSYSNWFDAHPEKIAGTPEISSSLMFPVKIKGTRQDVDRMFANINKY